jgi:hypothetical protein
VLGAAIVVLCASPAAADDTWSPAGETRGVALQSRPTATSFRAYRGAVAACTDLVSLLRFVADASRLREWIPHTAESHALPEQGGHALYYLRTSAPWPFKSRDMVYRLTPEPADEGGTIRIGLEGVPDALPARRDAVRMTAADGTWTFTPGGGRIHVELELAVDPGFAPAFFADRRLAATVAGTLANLAERFPCEP